MSTGYMLGAYEARIRKLAMSAVAPSRRERSLTGFEIAAVARMVRRAGYSRQGIGEQTSKRIDLPVADQVICS